MGNYLGRRISNRDITKRKLAEIALKESGQRWEAIISASPDGIGMASLDGKMQFVSDKLATMYGYSIEEKEELVRKGIFDFIDPSNHQMLIDNINKLNADKKENEITEYMAIKKDNSRFFVDVNSTLLFDSNGNPNNILFVERDITERKLIEETLKNSEEKYRKIFNNEIDAICIFDIQTKRILDVNKAYLRMYGYTREEVLKLTIDDISAEPEKSDRAVKHAAIAGDVIISERIHKKKDGTIIQVELSAGAYIWNGRNVMFALARDITDRKHSELIINQQNAELSKLNADKDRFISILAHDLKSPFNSILGFLGILSKNIRNYDIDKIEKQINIVGKTAQNTFKLLEDILLWVKAQSGKIPFEPQKLNFKDICKDVVEILKLNASNKNITINYIEVEDQHVFADENMLKTILLNLISNAIKFTNPAGRIDIYIEQNQVDKTITVSDNGIGIEPIILSMLFDIAQKITTSGTANETGTGLGLLLCKEFVEKHSGKIWVESEVGKGSDFKFTLPVKQK